MRFIILIAILLTSQCKGPETVSENNSCIDLKISELKQLPKAEVSIWSYTYKEKAVYFIPAHAQDMMSHLFDSDCNKICSPDGGFTGKGDGRCPDFFDQRKNEKVIWQSNER